MRYHEAVMSTRAELRQSGEAMRRRLFGNAGDGGPEIMRSLNTEAGFGAARHRVDWIGAAISCSFAISPHSAR